jgi:hypothetical protein
MTPMTCQWRSAAAGGEGSDDGDGGAATDWAGRRAMTGQPLPGDDRRRNDYEDYANHGAGKDDAPLDDGQRKRIRRMGMM